jgi:hypothetical protein
MRTMKSSFATLALLASVAGIALPTAASATTTLSNMANGGSIGTFGAGASPTYGQVFQAPITGKLSSFTLYLNGGVGALFGGVGTWNGGLGFATGSGSPSNLFQSADVAATAAGAYTFSPNMAVTAGQNYVAYLSTIGVAGASGGTTMQLGTQTAGLGSFVWNNSGDPRNNGQWDYFANFGTARFEAAFTSAIPEPSTWALMIVGFGAIGASMRSARSRSKVTFASA